MNSITLIPFPVLSVEDGIGEAVERVRGMLPAT